MTEIFLKMMEDIFDNEGKGFTNWKNDRGGPTQLGITLAFLKSTEDYELSDLDKDGDIDIDDIRLLDTVEKAAPIYYKYFYMQMRLDKFHPAVGFLLLDFGINSGQKRAKKHLQEALNRLGFRLVVDGVVGPATMNAFAKAVANYGVVVLVGRLLEVRREFYRAIVKSDPTQLGNLGGWLNRADKLKKQVRKFM